MTEQEEYNRKKELYKIIDFHIERGDLLSFASNIFSYKFMDILKYDFIKENFFYADSKELENIAHIYSCNGKDEYWEIHCENDLSEYIKGLNHKLFLEVDKHNASGDLDSWLNKLKKEKPALFRMYDEGSKKELLQAQIQEEILNARATDDFISYLWDFIDKNKIDFDAVKTYEESDDEYEVYELISPVAAEIFKSIKEQDRDECFHIFSMLESKKDDEDFFLSGEELKYFSGLAKTPHESTKYKLYLKISAKIRNSNLDKLVEEYNKKVRILKIAISSAIALILILIGAFSINRVVTKDARIAKKEAQRIEKQKVQEAKDLEKAQKNDLEMLEKLGNKKIALHELLTYTNEPKLYTIAPMTYDTVKFVENNSHEKGMLGSEKDYSTERLAVLESCITDFTHKVDELTGVSFLDRTKIAQIEKEHKFQLGDWSNDKKTAEVGKALNANIMLFFDKFAYIDSDYRFEAKFVDINTMQSASFNIVYKNPKKKIVTPENVGRISFKDFTANSVKDTSFEDELSLKAQGTIRTVQKNDLKTVSPLGNVAKLETSEFDVNMPKSEFASVSSIIVDGFDGIEVKTAGKSENYTYTFEPCDLYIERIGNDFYTDGKIGTLTIKTDSSYEKLDVFTVNDREYFLKLGTVELPKVTVNYYVQMVKK